MSHKRYLAVILAFTGPFAVAQQPLAPRSASGQTVTPVYEGWYANPDGSYSLSFGYYNRNTSEVVEIPLGPENVLGSPGTSQNQPVTLHPGRHWGVFTVVVPKDWEPTRKVVWTLKNRGETFTIPGSLHVDWQIDALEGEVSAGNTPPVLRFAEQGPEGRGPGGLSVGPMLVKAGTPLELSVRVKDDGKGASNIVAQGADGAPVTLTWFKHQGPGAVLFSQISARVASNNGVMNVTAMFSRPGEYVVRVRANDASGVTSGGHAQCCWTNGFVKVTVTP